MTFEEACNRQPALYGHSKPGLRALKSVDRRLVGKSRRTKLTTSIDLDRALVSVLPNAPRWDYAVGVEQGRGEAIRWIEVHPASSGRNLQEVEAKLAWLGEWLQASELKKFPRQVIWLASGRSSFNARDPRIKALASKGLTFSGGWLAL